MCERQPTEIDQLLPTPVSNRKSYSEENEDQSRRRRIVLAGAAALVLVFSVHSVLPSKGRSHRHRPQTKDRDFKAKEQLGALQQLTEKSLTHAQAVAANVTPSLRSQSHHHHKSHPKEEIEVIKDKEYNHNGRDGGVYHCTSRVMIMRHCDKQVKVTIGGKKHITDKRDKYGDRHCSAKGKKRSEYIATLFVEPDDYQQLVEDKNHGKDKEIIEDGIPPVPMIKSSLSKVSSAAAKKKPQFPSPHKLYALSSARPADKPSKEHENFREIETITPLSNKFHLDVDERFGVNEEGDLASDFFDNLSKSVTKNVDYHLMMMKNPELFSNENVLKHKNEHQPISSSSSLCNNGMTVVNWKHSRIPILARALGCGKNQGCPKKYNGDDFDTVWLLTFQYSLLLGSEGNGDNDSLDVDSSVLALESLAQSSSSSLRHHKKKSHSEGHDPHGIWKITAELVNEGFDPN